MSTFKRYAGYYDLLYRDKDYAGEAAFVRRRIRKHAPGARSLLELGCGTARHAREFVRHGWRVLAVDRSKAMVRLAEAERARLPARLRKNLQLGIGDASRFRSRQPFDAAVSLFHVVNYQLADAALRGMFRSARRALRPGGIFLFDFWYGPGVRADPPALRIKRVESKTTRILRLAEPVHDSKRHRVDVNYTLIATDRRTGRSERIEETHAVRYLFLPEIRRLGSAAGLKLVESGAWLSGRPLSGRSWLGYAVLRAVGGS